LRGFYYTVKLGGLTAATASMHRNQSAITYQIQSLENMYGVPLFTSGRGKRDLTEEGKFLYTKAIELFSEIDGLRSEIDQESLSEGGEIRVAAPNSILEYFLPDHIARFRSQCPGARFILEGIDTPQGALQMLDSRQTDFALVNLTGIPNSFETTPLFSSAIILITPKTGPYALTTAELDLLGDMPFIAPSSGSSLDVNLRSQMARLGLEMRNEILSSSTGGAKAFVAEGLGVAFLRAFSVTEEEEAIFNVVSMAPMFKPMTYGVVRRKVLAMPSLLCEDFLRYLVDDVASGNK